MIYSALAVVAVLSAQPIDIQGRIDAAAEKGGGTVAVERGEWIAKPFALRSNVTLALAEGAVVYASTNLVDYAHMTRGNRYFVYAEGATNVAIVGRGVLDGQGWAFRESRRLPGESQPQDLPVMMRFSRCRNLRLEGFTYRNCGAWGCHLRNCDGVVARRLRCFSHANRTNDGIDIESSNVLVEDCDIDSGDDAVVFKTESDKSFPVTNVVVRNCRIASRCNGVKFGTGSYCDVRGITIENCVLHRPWANPRASSRTVFPGVTNAVAGLAGLAVEVVDGGRLEDVTFRNLKVEGFMVPFFVRLGRRRAPILPEKGTYLRNVLFENVDAVADSRIGNSVTGVPGLRPRGIIFRNVNVVCRGGGSSADAERSVPEMECAYPECTMFHEGFPDNLVCSELALPAWGMYIRHADDIRFEKCNFSVDAPDARRPFVADDAQLPTPRAEVRIMTYNVCHCEGMDGRIDVARTAARINAENPDFACLQEIDWCTARVSGMDEPAELARRTGMHATFAKAIFYRGGQYGVMMLSREKPIDVVQLPLPGAEPRVLLVCEFRDCVVATSHLSVSGKEEREASVPIIRSAFAKYKKPVFFTGDWNATPGSDVMKSLGQFLTVLSDTTGRTFHGRSEMGPQGELLDKTPFCIDYVAVDAGHARDFEVVDTHVVEDRVTSDHAPVVATVSFARPELPEPAVVPLPVSLKLTGGQWRAQASDVTPALYKAKIDTTIPDGEGYRISITEKNGIAVTCADAVGAEYALQTLRQLAVWSWGRLAFPCCEIDDYPRFGWRGVHIDESRHFFGKAAVKRILDQMAMHKLNVLHWHLTDSQGWRLPIAKYPLLTTVGAQRPYSTNQKNLADHFEDGTYGPYSYSREEIAEIVAYAGERFISILPEVDVPGHSAALLRAYPEMGCFGENPSAAPSDAVKNVVCAGDDRVLEMVKDVFDEVAAMFPWGMIHIGGDEVNKANWRACPKCQARMKKHGLKTENDLQAWFMGEIAGHLAKKGRRVVGWDEIILDGAAPKGCVVMSWRGAEGGRAAAAAGHESVMCPHVSCYFDYSQSLEDDPATYPWFTLPLPLEKAYAYDPLDGIPESQRRFVLGGQCCNWSEYTCNETELQWKMWPRTCATAEVFWSPAGKRDYGDFLRRMERHRRRLVGAGVNCAPLR